MQQRARQHKLQYNAERGVDLSAAQEVDLPTRDVLVVFDNTGDREFIGFGSAKANEFADCFISAEHLPEDTVKASAFLATLQWQACQVSIHASCGLQLEHFQQTSVFACLP